MFEMLFHFISLSNRRDTEEEEPIAVCPQNIALKWHAEMSSSVYATPLITDLYADGLKDIIVPSFSKQIEVVEGRDGAKVADFEAFHESTIHAAPLMYDIDFDGVPDIVQATYDGDVFFFKDIGGLAVPKLTVPRLKVSKNWFAGLDPDPIDHSQPDIGDDPAVGTKSRRSLLQEDTGGVETEGHVLSEEGADTFDELFGGDDDYDPAALENIAEHEAEADDDDYVPWDGDYHHIDLDARQEELWQDEFHHQIHGDAEWQSPHIYVDAHILATPAVGDIDGDGRDELVLAVSYFYDSNYYELEENKHKIPKDIDLRRYVASGVVVFDVQRRSIKWSQHLDLTSDYTQYKAYAYSSPTLADVNGDGVLEVVLGTSVGFLYVLDGRSGDALEGWPLQMGDIQGQVAVADLNGDGSLEIVAADSRGNVAAFTGGAKEIWERHLNSQVGAGATFGDVNGDGELEVILGSWNGYVHVLSGRTGEDVGPFPFKAFGKITAPILPTKLNNPSQPGLQLVVLAFDGYLYVIDGVTGCADTLDIGEQSYAMVLADDIDADGRLELLASTVNGNIYAISTGSKYQPLKTWPQQVPGGGGNAFTARWNWQGVYVTGDSRRPRDIRSRTLPVQFTIVDERAHAQGVGSAATSSYKVSVVLSGVGAKEMNSGDQPVIGMADIYNKTGTYTIEIPCPRSRSTAVVRVQMKTEASLTYSDEFSLSFHVHFYRLLKWLVVLPFMFAAVAVLGTDWQQQQHESEDDNERLPIRMMQAVGPAPSSGYYTKSSHII